MILVSPPGVATSQPVSRPPLWGAPRRPVVDNRAGAGGMLAAGGRAFGARRLTILAAPGPVMRVFMGSIVRSSQDFDHRGGLSVALIIIDPFAELDEKLMTT
jgi:hypothetical protein